MKTETIAAPSQSSTDHPSALIGMEGIQETVAPQELVFTVSHSSAVGAQRTGELKLGSKTLQTPALLVHSRHGSPQNLTPDLVAKLEELKAVHINVKDFVVQVDTFAKYGLGGHKFLVLEDQILMLAYNDPAEFDAAPNLGKALNLNAIGGKRKIDSPSWVKLQRSFRADLFSAMSFDVQFYSSNKRISKCVDATIAWLDELLPPHAQNKKSVLPQGAKSTDGSSDYTSLGGGAMFAVIQGANNEFERRRCAKAIVDRMALYAPAQPIQGFIYGGFGVDDLPEDRSKHIALTTSLLPAEYPRLLPVVDSPEDILDAVAQGIDLFSNSYPGRLAELGHAFTFAINNFDATVTDSHAASSSDQPMPPNPLPFVPAEMGGDRNKICLKDPFYELDKTPLLQGCTCYTCTKHTRAYIHHLINTHEMLATILLVIHNTHHYLAFFNEIRKSIAADQFPTYQSQFVECYQRPL